MSEVNYTNRESIFNDNIAKQMNYYAKRETRLNKTDLKQCGVSWFRKIEK